MKNIIGKSKTRAFYWLLTLWGYLDHNEHPTIGAVRETMEELGITLKLMIRIHP